MRRCVDCPASIEDRTPWARLCRPCAARRQEKRNKERFWLLIRNAAEHKRVKTYQRDWDRRRATARPDKTAKCLGCFVTFVLNRVGAPRRYCRECAAMFHKDRRSVSYRKWYRTNRAKQLARMAIYRERMRRAA